MRATPEMIEELKWQSRGRSFDTMPVYHAKEEDLDAQTILQFLNERKETKKIKTLSNDLLSAYELIHEEHSLVHPTAAGVLLFGKNPQKFFPEAMIISTLYNF